MISILFFSRVNSIALNCISSLCAYSSRKVAETEHLWPSTPATASRLTSPRRCLRAFVVSEGVCKIRDLLTMFAPTRVCARSLAYVYPVTHKRGVPRRAGPFRRRRPSAPEIHRRYFIPGDFYEPIYHTSTGARRGWRCAAGGLGPRRGRVRFAGVSAC